MTKKKKKAVINAYTDLAKKKEKRKQKKEKKGYFWPGPECTF
jgi:hypothetical protein